MRDRPQASRARREEVDHESGGIASVQTNQRIAFAKGVRAPLDRIHQGSVRLPLSAGPESRASRLLPRDVPQARQEAHPRLRAKLR